MATPEQDIERETGKFEKNVAAGYGNMINAPTDNVDIDQRKINNPHQPVIQPIINFEYNGSAIYSRATECGNTGLVPPRPTTSGIVSTKREITPHSCSRDEIVVWLTPFSIKNFRKKHKDLLDGSVPGTGDWLLKCKEFGDWRNGRCRLLWCHGFLGTGKTVLTSIVIDHIEKGIRDKGDDAACVYVYFDQKSKEQPSPSRILASLLLQLMENQRHDRIIDMLKQNFNKFHPRRESPNFEEYLELVKAQTGTYSRVFLVVDALDECQEHPASNTREKFLVALSQLPQNVKILLTSRPSEYLRGKLAAIEPNAQQYLKIEAHPTDLRLYIESRIKAHEKMQKLIEGAEKNHKVAPEKQHTFREIVIKTVIHKAQGLFFLAKSHMDCLTSQRILSHFRSALDKLPDTTEAYDKALRRINLQDTNQQQLAKHVFSWLLFAVRPLTVNEICHAFAVSVNGRDRSVLDKESVPEEDDLTEVCAGIVIIDDKSKIVLPMHETVQKYLRSIPEKISGEEDIASICLTYLSYDEFAEVPCSRFEIDDRISRYPLLKYAASHWFDHFRQCGDNEAVKGQALALLQNTGKVTSCFQVTSGPNQNIPKGVTGLHAVAYYDLQNMTKGLLLNGAIIDAACDDGQTALHWSARYGRRGQVELLLQESADKNIQDQEGNTPLHLAVANGHASVVELLIKVGAKLDVWNKRNWTPLRWALRYGLRNEAHLLVENKAEVNIEDREGWTVLRLALRYAPSEVRLLLDNGEDVNRQSADGWTPLKQAAQHGREDLVSLLLEKGAQVNLRDRDGFTPLRWAVMYGHPGVVKLLIDYGADVDARCKNGQTSLMQAGLSGLKLLVWLLLECRAKIDVKDNDGRTVLHYAIRKGHKSIIWLLLESLDKPDISDKNGRTALHSAAEEGDSSVVWLLLGKRADINFQDNDKLTALHVAARGGKDDVVELLMKRDASIDIADNNGLTALHHAARGGHTVIVKRLVEKANINIQDRCGLTALHHATCLMSQEIVKILIEESADVCLQDSQGFTAIHDAVIHDDLSVMLQLLKRRQGLDLRDTEGRTALVWAAQLGRDAAVLRLLKDGANADVQDNHGWTAQDYAAHNGYDFIRQMLSFPEWWSSQRG